MNILQLLGLACMIIILTIVCTCKTEYFNKEVAKKQEVYRHVLKTTIDVLDDLKIPHFLSSGTCLGYARERNFIEHDYDIDIGIRDSDCESITDLVQAMHDAGMHLYRILGSAETGIELSFYNPIGAKVDIFIHKLGKSDGKLCWYSYDKTKTRKLEYCVSDFDVAEVDFLGLKVNVPDPVTKYLQEHYGKDWRIPRGTGILGGYSYDSSPKSLTLTT